MTTSVDHGIRPLSRAECAGTDGLETNELWQTPEIRQLNGLKALREGGDPAELLHKLKETLFAA